MSKKTHRLTPMQRKWADAVLAGETYTEAARIAGYAGAESTLASTGSENARKPKIQAYLADVRSKSPLVADRNDRQEFWTRVMLDPDEKMTDRLKASRLLGKSQADFVDRVEASVSHQATDYDLSFAPLGGGDGDD